MEASLNEKRNGGAHAAHECVERGPRGAPRAMSRGQFHASMARGWPLMNLGLGHRQTEERSCAPDVQAPAASSRACAAGVPDFLHSNNDTTGDRYAQKFLCSESKRGNQSRKQNYTNTSTDNGEVGSSNERMSMGHTPRTQSKRI